MVVPAASRAGGGSGGRLQPRHRAEAVHGGDGEIIAQPPFRGRAVEHVAGQGRHRRQLPQQGSEIGIAIQRVGDDHFMGVDARKRRRELAGRAFGDDEFRGRNVDPGQPDAVGSRRGAAPRDRQQVIVGPGVEQGVFGQRARRHQTHHAAAHHALVAAGPRRGRILGLLADRDAMACRDQPVQIVLGALHRDAAHRDVQALMLAAFRQHDAERPGGDFGILEEQFVEVAHPVEQQQPGMGGLDLEVLLHHRRDARRLGGRGGVGCLRKRLLDRHCGGKLQNFAAGSYRFAAVNRVFHLRRA
jgi:hypothetical protein